jgi:hypothetical protein
MSRKLRKSNKVKRYKTRKSPRKSQRKSHRKSYRKSYRKSKSKSQRKTQRKLKSKSKKSQRKTQRKSKSKSNTGLRSQSLEEMREELRKLMEESEKIRLQREKLRLEEERLRLEEEKINQKERELEHISKDDLTLSTLINLNKFKPLFKEALKLPYETGFNVFYDKDIINFEVSKGVDKFVTIPYDVVIGIHTHPSFLYKSDYKPPSHTDYIQSIYDFIKTKSINIVVEESGMWIYGPNKNLIDEVYRVQPDINDILGVELKEGEQTRGFDVGDRLFELIDVLDYNANNEHQNLVLNKKMVIRIIVNHILEERPTKEFVKQLEKEDMNTLLKRYNIQKEKIDIQEYIKRMEDLAGSGGIGFNVTYIPWRDPFEFEINMTQQYLDIFNKIKDRGLNVFDERDVDIFADIANRTEDGRILRKD